ncbi:B9 domain-containing protein 1-like [Tribolium madens]|uniref:B9 domain-containing protein 1-like n=1 Tax=Tribolium madens TaxID=41895 RepID=UPI001CF74159|nr:B9 domain-containing protein 1-like [Tribolium madens]
MSEGTFLVSLTGQIESLDILAPAGSSWHCKYEFVTGPDWKIIGGLEAGLSQTANVVVNGARVVFNLPIEITFKSTNIYGWPQIVISVYRGVQLEGYGRAHMPLRPGAHRVDVALSKPQASSLLGHMGALFGYQPELLQPKMLATTAGNHLIQMLSHGEVRVSVNVVMQGVRSLGYDFGRGKD